MYALKKEVPVDSCNVTVLNLEYYLCSSFQRNMRMLRLEKEYFHFVCGKQWMSRQVF